MVPYAYLAAAILRKLADKRKASKAPLRWVILSSTCRFEPASCNFFPEVNVQIVTWMLTTCLAVKLQFQWKPVLASEVVLVIRGVAKGSEERLS